MALVQPTYDIQLFRRLNMSIRRIPPNPAQPFTIADNIGEIINYLNTGQYPARMNTNVKRQRYSDTFDAFVVNNNQLQFVYQQANAALNQAEIRLRVYRTEQDIENRLIELYDDTSSGIGKGILKFYEVVSTTSLNITRDTVVDFLRRQLPYQLTRNTVKSKNPMKKYTVPGTWALDLINMRNLRQQNHGHLSILSVVDLATKRCWLRSLPGSTAVQVRNAFQTIIVANNNTNPNLLMMDNGKEFKAAFATFLAAQNIRVYNSNTYTPVSPIERVNQEVRKQVAEIATRNRNLIWHTHLQEIEDSINLATQNWRTKEKRVEENARTVARDLLTPPNAPKFNVGDEVRVSQRAFNTEIRRLNKTGLVKQVYIKRSVLTYRVHERFNRSVVNGFYTYNLNYLHGQAVVGVLNGPRLLYRESDLTGASLANTRQPVMTQAQSNILNRI